MISRGYHGDRGLAPSRTWLVTVNRDWLRGQETARSFEDAAEAGQQLVQPLLAVDPLQHERQVAGQVHQGGGVDDAVGAEAGNPPADGCPGGPLAPEVLDEHLPEWSPQECPALVVALTKVDAHA